MRREERPHVRPQLRCFHARSWARSVPPRAPVPPRRRDRLAGVWRASSLGEKKEEGQEKDLACAANLCGGDDGCGGICGCAAAFVCQAGVCHACTVTCSGGGTACAADLTTALAGAAGGTVYVCPGRYVGTFIMPNGALVGAGDGDDPATSTILDAIGAGRVVTVASGVTAALHGLRITGGTTTVGSGAGIANSGTLTMTECTIDKNHSADDGGGILSNGPKLTLTACVVSGNTCPQDGGGILAGGVVTIHGSAFTGNMAGGFGGGLHCSGAITFDSASSVTGNTCSAANCGGGITRLGGTVALNGAAVSGNTPNNCRDVPGC